MLFNDQTGHIRIKCVFQQGTPLREYVIIQSEKGKYPTLPFANAKYFNV